MKKNIKDAELAQSVAEDIQKIISSDKDIVDAGYLREYTIEREKSAQNTIKNLTNHKRRDSIIEDFADFNSADKMIHLKHKLEQKQNRARKIKVLKYASSIAAAMVVLYISLYDTTDNKPIINQIATVQPILKPTIINENREYIEIDEGTTKIAQNNYTVQQNEKTLSYTESKTEEIKYNELVIPANYNYNLVLSDSTEVILNAGSRIKYPVNFVGDIREVELSGEAYFKVKKSSKPFVVKVEKMTIKVYGTIFNVNTLSGSIKTVLAEGSIGVTVENKKEIMVKPNQLFVYDKQTYSSYIQDVIASDYTTWIRNEFFYKERPLKDVLTDLSRWYNITIDTDIDLTNITVSLYSSRDFKVEEVFELIEMSKDIKFIKEGGARYNISK